MESIDTLNLRLEKFFGHFDDGRPRFRIVWSDDQREMRFGTFDNFSPNGIYLGRETGYQYVPRYAYMPCQWVLEHLVPVPDVNRKELANLKMSYEPIWGFNTIPDRSEPPWDVVKRIVDSLNEAVSRGRSQIAKYKESLANTHTKEGIEAQAEITKKELFDGESDSASMALHTGSGVVVPSSYDGDVK